MGGKDGNSITVIVSVQTICDQCLNIITGSDFCFLPIADARQCHFCVSAECALFIEGMVGCVGRGLEKRWWMYKVRITLIRIMFTGLAGFIFDVLAHFHGSFC